MQRRQFLAAGGAAATPLAGCLGGTGGSPSGDSSRSPTTSTPDRHSTDPSTDVTIPSPDGRCGSAAAPQSDHFVGGGGGPPDCYDGAETSLAIENERGAEADVRVEITSGREAMFQESYSLSPDERAVERSVLPAHDAHTASVTIDDGETVTGGWDGTSCFRHGISIVPEGVEFGLVPPLSGPGDTQHDCYAGDDALIGIYNSEEPNTVSLYVVDHCSETVHERTLSLAPDAGEHVDDLLVNGGVYDVIVVVDGGHSAAYRFYDECWGVTAGIEEDGNVSVNQMLID